MNDFPGQLVLDYTQGYRNGQDTSKEADEEATKKFKARHTQLVYMAVRNHCNGGTAREIAKAGNVPHRIVWRWLHDLWDNEYLRNGSPRKCEISGRICKTWWIV